jgi:hypothetical protein
VLSPEQYAAYSQALHLAPSAGEKRKEARLPQFFADRFGWPELVAAVADVYNGLTPQERARCVILASNYGEAGALDFFGRRYGLPRAVSGHNNYYLWGPGTRVAEVLIAVNVPRDDLKRLFSDVQQAATTPDHPYAMPDETGLPIFVCRKPIVSLQEAWPRFKNYF